MTNLRELPTTNSGHVRKAKAMKWMSEIDETSAEEIGETVIPKPSGFEGSKYATAVSDVRVTGSPAFVEAVAGLFKPFQDFESRATRLEINLRETEDRESGKRTGNFALYLSVAERGSQGF